MSEVQKGLKAHELDLTWKKEDWGAAMKNADFAQAKSEPKGRKDAAPGDANTNAQNKRGREP